MAALACCGCAAVTKAHSGLKQKAADSLRCADHAFPLLFGTLLLLVLTVSLRPSYTGQTGLYIVADVI